jgi:hypothetical protein
LKRLLPGTPLVTKISSLEKWAHVQLYDNPEVVGYVMRKYTEEVLA